MDVVYKDGIWLCPRVLPLRTYTHAQAGICGGPCRATTPWRSAISNLQVLGRDEAQKLLMRVREAHWPAIKSRVVAILGKEMAKLTPHTFTPDSQRRVHNVSKEALLLHADTNKDRNFGLESVATQHFLRHGVLEKIVSTARSIEVDHGVGASEVDSIATTDAVHLFGCTHPAKPKETWKSRA